MLKKLLTALALSALILPLIPAFGGTSAKTEASIIEEDIEYLPEDQEVHVGQLIHIVNKDPFDHKSRVTLQLEDGRLGEIALKDHVDKPGSDYAFRLNRAGTYEIRCMLHDGMTATIHVVK